MFIERINPLIKFYDDGKVYTYEDLIQKVKSVQASIGGYGKSYIVGIASGSCFIELCAILGVLEMGHRIIYIKEKVMLEREEYSELANEMDILINILGDRNEEIRAGKDTVIMKQEDIFSKAGDELILETDETKKGFLFFTSGTTGVPKKIEQTHKRLIHAANQVCERIWQDNKNHLLFRTNTINHLGILTTIYLPSLFSGETVTWFGAPTWAREYKLEDYQVKSNCVLIFPYQNTLDLNTLPLKRGTKVITGGMHISRDFNENIFSYDVFDAVYNVHGATEIVTPMMWCKNIGGNIKDQFDEVLEGLVFNKKGDGSISTVSGFSDNGEEVGMPDLIYEKEVGKFSFVRRIKPNLIRSSYGKEVEMAEDFLFTLISKNFGNQFMHPGVKIKPFVVRIERNQKIDDDNYIVYDSVFDTGIKRIGLEGINDMICNHYGIEKSSLNKPFFNYLYPIENIEKFNNGLKIDMSIITEKIKSELIK